MPQPAWTDQHTEIAEYWLARGVSYRQVARAFGFSDSTVHRNTTDIRDLRAYYRASLIRFCEPELHALGIDPGHAQDAIIDEA